MWTSRPRFTLFPVTSGLRLMIGGSAGQRDRHSDTRPGAQGHPARPAAAVHAGLGDGFTGHVGMAQDLARSGVELPALMTASRWKSSRMPARYTEREAAHRGAVARYYQETGGG